jgi:hypothetical protein
LIFRKPNYKRSAHEEARFGFNRGTSVAAMQELRLLSRYVVALRALFRAAAIRLSLPMVSIHFQDAVW